MNAGPKRRWDGTMGLIAGDLGRYTDFTTSLAIMQKPPTLRLVVGKSTDVVGNCNLICRNVEGDWLFLMGDDHVFDPDILLRLLAHDVDIVVPLVFTRTPPYKPVVVDAEDHVDELGHTVYRVAHDLPEHGLREVYAAGSAGMLIKRWVLDEIADPWFATDGRGLNEDFTFCAKARDVGARIYVDVDTPMGHIAPHTVWPDYRDGGWHPNLILGPDTVVPLKNIVREEVPA